VKLIQSFLEPLATVTEQKGDGDDHADADDAKHNEYRSPQRESDVDEEDDNGMSVHLTDFDVLSYVSPAVIKLRNEFEQVDTIPADQVIARISSIVNDFLLVNGGAMVSALCDPIDVEFEPIIQQVVQAATNTSTAIGTGSDSQSDTVPDGIDQPNMTQNDTYQCAYIVLCELFKIQNPPPL
jgi:hypothetical protein